MDEVERFSRFCAEILKLELEPFQLKIVREVFSLRRESLILLPRGNGKSTLLAAIALWHLLSAHEPMVAIGAASREQAATLFDIARGMAAHASIAPRVELTRREIRTSAGWLRVVASDGPKQHGLILSLAIVDELHAHRDSELYTALRTGMLKRRDARITTISTAGSDDDSALGELRRRAMELPEVERKGPFVEALGPNLAMLEWSLDSSADVDDMSIVKSVNPLSSITEEDLAEQREAVHEAAFRRYHCNQWIAGVESAIPAGEWQACAQPGLEIPEDAEGVVVGIDLGWRGDTTALVPIYRPGPNQPVQIHPPVILVPKGDGSSLDADDIYAVCEDFTERWPRVTFCLDPESGGDQLAQRLDKELRATVMTHSQKTGPMSQASQLLSETIASEGLEHPDDPELTKHVLNAAARWYGSQWRFVKAKGSSLPIDGVIATAMALRVLLAADQSGAARSEATVPASTVYFTGR